MLSKICTIYDGKAQAYLLPMYFQSLAQAERSFGDIVNDKEHPIGCHPEDYTLWCIGEWDEQTGIIVVFDVKQSIAEGIQLYRGIG